MPRIYDSRSNPIDFCKRCFPKTEAAAFVRFGNLGDGPDGRGNCFGYDDEHPDYDGEDYTCHDCRKRLTGKDNDSGSLRAYFKACDAKPDWRP